MVKICRLVCPLFKKNILETGVYHCLQVESTQMGSIERSSLSPKLWFKNTTFRRLDSSLIQCNVHDMTRFVAPTYSYFGPYSSILGRIHKSDMFWNCFKIISSRLVNTGLLDLSTLSVSWFSKEYNVSETGFVSVLRWRGERVPTILSCLLL
jgi:hypothetical protein